SRLTLRLMEDVVVPATVPLRAAVPSPPFARPTQYIPSPYGLLRPASYVNRATAASAPEVATTNPPAYVEQMEQVPAERSLDEMAATTQPSAAPNDRTTLVILKGGAAFVSREYWVQGGQLECVSETGEHKTFALDNVDLSQTLRLNRERNVEFVLHSKGGVVEQEVSVVGQTRPPGNWRDACPTFTMS